MLDEIRNQTEKAVEEFLEKSKVKAGDVVVVGCSSSEIGGDNIGSNSNLEVAQTVFEAIYAKLKEKDIFLAAQCCEHLNRAVIVERRVAEKQGLDEVNVIPQPKAGGSFATTAYARFADPVAVEKICADGGMDIGGTLIGMHIKEVVVPLHLSVRYIGKATLNCARRRPKFVGGQRAVYNQDLL